MAIWLDLVPHYRIILDNFSQTNPITLLGQPGRYQGLNTGIVLFDYEKMRKSVPYNTYLNPAKVDKLFQTCHVKMTVGDQDWFTLLSFHQPKPISILPCYFNTNTSLLTRTPSIVTTIVLSQAISRYSMAMAVDLSQSIVKVAECESKMDYIINDLLYYLLPQK